MPKKRTASFSGSAYAAWPSLSVDGGGTQSWNTPAALYGASSTRYESIVAILDGSGNGAFGFTYNQPPVFAAQLTTSTGTTAGWSSTTDATNFLFPNSAVQPTVGATSTLVFVFQSTAASQHYHQLDLTGVQSTGCWTAATFTKVAESSSSVGTFSRQTIWVVTNLGTGFGRVRLRLKDVQGATTYTSAVTPTGGGGTGTNNITATSAAGLPILITGTPGGASGVNSLNTASASGTGVTSALTLNTATSGNFTRYNNVTLAAFIRAENALSAATNSATKIVATDNVGTNPTAAYTVATSYPTGSTDATRVNPTSSITGTSVAWAGVGIEVKDATTNNNTYFLDRTDLSAVTLAGTTTRYSTTVRGTTPSGQAVAQQAGGDALNRMLVARHCTVGGSDYFVALTFQQLSGGQAGKAQVVATLNGPNGSNISLSQLLQANANQAYNVGGDMRQLALRVRGHSAGGLWIDLKVWDSAVAEPAWPSTEPAAAVSGNLGTQTSSTTSTTIVVSVNDRRTDAVTIAANPGKNGLGLTQNYGASSVTEGTPYTYSWTSWEDDDVVTEIAASDLSGATGLNGSGDITVATGGATTVMAATIDPASAATSSLSATPSIITVATATRTDATGLVGTGSLIADVAVITTGSAALASVASELVTSVIVKDLEALTLTGNTGTLTADATITSVADASLTATGTLSATPLGYAVETVTLTAVGSTLSSDAIRITFTDAALTGTSTFETVDATSIALTAVALSGASAIESVSAILLSTGSASLAGTGSLAAAGATVTERVTLAGTGALTASAAPILIATATLSGTTSLTVLEETEYPIRFSGTGALTGTATRVLVASATLSGTSTGTAAATRVLVADSTLTGAAAGTAAAMHVNVASSTLSGTGTLTGAGTHVNVATATCTGLGQTVCDATHVNVVAATCTGQGTVVPSVLLEAHTASVLTGVSTFTETLVGVAYEALALDAVGELLVEGKAVHYIADTLRNTTSRKLGGAYSTLPVTDGGEPLAGTATLSRKVGTGIMVSVPKEQ